MDIKAEVLQYLVEDARNRTMPEIADGLRVKFEEAIQTALGQLVKDKLIEPHRDRPFWHYRAVATEPVRRR